METIKEVLNFRGSMGRGMYAAIYGLNILLWAVVLGVAGSFPEGAVMPPPLSALVISALLLSLWAGLSSTLKRLTDCGWSRFTIMLFAVPLAGVILQIILFFKEPKPVETPA